MSSNDKLPIIGPTEAKYAQLPLFLIDIDDVFDSGLPKGTWFEPTEHREDRLKLVDRFYQSPLCRACLFPTGPRSDEPLHVSVAPRKSDGAIGRAGHEDVAILEIFSSEFVNLLTPRERDGLDLRPILRSGQTRKFFEVVGPPGPPFVAPIDLEPNGWRCEQCGYSGFGFWIEGLDINSFICAADLPSPLPGVFTVGASPDVRLCATAQRWSELVGRKGTRGIGVSLLGVVSEQDAIRQPSLPTRAERLEETDRRRASQ